MTDVLIGVFDLDRGSTGDALLLSADEQQRAQRLTFDVHRERYIAGRAAVRRTLGDVVGADPAGLVFHYGEHGRPDVEGHGAVSFNFSNSESVGILAVCLTARIGVDVEKVRPDFADLRVADRFFAAGETARLQGLPADERNLAFLRCWTRKEALLKAVGAGLTLPLRDFEVSFEADEPARLLVAGPVLGADGWQLLDVSDAAAGYIGAVAVAASGAIVCSAHREPQGQPG